MASPGLEATATAANYIHVGNYSTVRVPPPRVAAANSG